jgi:acyl-coenzyme A synthetase/AMP-(fatty) acid ligase
VELGEVQAALSQHAGVREVLVVAVDDPHQEKTLVAYLTKSNFDISHAELRAVLQVSDWNKGSKKGRRSPEP